MSLSPQEEYRPDHADRHPLHRKIREGMWSIRNWHEWLRLWEKATTTQEAAGLIHCMYDVPMHRVDCSEPSYDTVERDSFALSIANGWNRENFIPYREEFQSPYGPLSDRDEKEASKIFRSLAQQALGKLISHVFNQEPKDGDCYRPHWLDNICGGDFFQNIRWFFRTTTEGDHRQWVSIYNLPRGGKKWSAQEEKLVHFVMKIVTTIWDNHYSRTKTTDLEAAKPWSIEVLSQLGRLHFLKEHLLELDQASVDKLMEICTRSPLRGYKQYEYPRDSQYASSVAEAHLMGSPAAELLVLRETAIKERKRQEAKQAQSLEVAAAAIRWLQK